MLLVRMGLPGAADDLARMVYKKVKPLQLSLPSLADECPELGMVRGELKLVSRSGWAGSLPWRALLAEFG